MTRDSSVLESNYHVTGQEVSKRQTKVMNAGAGISSGISRAPLLRSATPLPQSVHIFSVSSPVTD
jgi:hypothetical protein